MRQQIAKMIRQIKALWENSRPELEIDNAIIDLKSAIASEGQLKYFFGDLPENYKLSFSGYSHGAPNISHILERDAQLFEADGITDDIKKLHMIDPIEVFLKLDQVRAILKERVISHFKFNPDQELERRFWGEYKTIGCDQTFTYDRYDRLVKLINEFGLPQSILRCYSDIDGNQLKQGDTVETVRDVTCVRSSKKIPRGTKLVIRELHYLDNYVEANFSSDAWAFHASQVLKI